MKKKEEWEKEYEKLVVRSVFGEDFACTINQMKSFISNLLQKERKEAYEKGYKKGIEEKIGKEEK